MPQGASERPAGVTLAPVHRPARASVVRALAARMSATVQ